jgi:N-dimethylarginine dimethylaminohydrolase
LSQITVERVERRTRSPRPRRFLMCPPQHFDVTYSINPWMQPTRATDTTLALRQWQQLRHLYLGLGHTVEQVNALSGLPDMVFAANGATVIDGRVLAARFRYAERVPEAVAYADWLTAGGYHVQQAEFVNEGEGDYLFTGERILAGSGFRTDPRSHAEAQQVFGRPVVSLQLVDPRFYHLDTALAVLDHDEIMYYPAAFAPQSQQTLRTLYPDAILATAADAEAFGLNAVSDGLHVILAERATDLAEQLRQNGFVPVGVDLSELMKSGGSAKCCTLELRP